MYTIEEFAKLIDRTIFTVRFWIKNGYLEKKKFSGSLFFTDEDVKKSEQIKKALKNRKISLMNWARENKNDTKTN
jgi:DNA-binding transcriptional MerR regulator